MFRIIYEIIHINKKRVITLGGREAGHVVH
jgi:hypothetical protein